MSIFNEAMRGQMGGLEFVQQGIAQGEEKRRVDGLRGLMGDYYGKQDPMLGQVARLGGNAGALQQDQRAQAMEKAKFYAGILLRTPKEMRAQVWEQQVAPGLNSAGLPVDGPYRDEYEGIAMQLAGGEATKPMNVSPGGQIVDPVTGRVIHSNGNFAPQKPVWDSVRGAWIEAPGGMGSVPAPMPAPGGAPAAPQGGVPAMQLASLFKSFGGQLTSGYRDPAKNAAVGGVANSQHMRGTGMDFVFPSPAIKAQAMQFAKANGYEAIDEGDHVHFELPGAAQQGGPRAVVPAGLPARVDYEAQRLELARQAAARADQAAADAAEARRRSRWGAAPAGQRFNDQGVLVPIPGYVPPKGANGDEAKGAAGAAGLKEDAYAYAASDTGVDAAVLRKMTPQQVRDLVKGKPVEVGGRSYTRQSRWMTGPITGRIPGAGLFANADLEAYRSSAAGKQARVNNPTGPVTNADFEVGAKSVWGPDKPDEVNADLIFNALSRNASAAAPADSGGLTPAEQAELDELRKRFGKR